MSLKKYLKNKINIEKNLKIEIIKMEDDFMEFDIIGVDVSIVNALRRIILSDVK